MSGKLRSKIANWLLLLCVMLSSTTWAYAVDDLTAVQIIRKTVVASGGESWRRPQTLHLKGKATLYWGDQVYSMKRYEMWRVFPGSSTSAHEANGKVRFDAAMPDGRYFFQIAFDGRKSSRKISKEAQTEADLLKWGNNFGFGIIRFAESKGFKLTRLPDDLVDGHSSYFVNVRDKKGTNTIFGIDKKLHLIRYAAFDTPIGFHERIYSKFKWHRNPKFIQPGYLRVKVDGKKIADVYWDEFVVNGSIEDSVFSNLD